ncbi:MAG: TolC family protein [Cyanobacteria bacterium P01_A01_bin.83]
MIIAISQTTTIYAEEIGNSNLNNTRNSVNPERLIKLLTNNKFMASDENKLLPTSNNITTNIIKPDQQSISETIELNPSKNPLSLPTKPESVDTPTQTPITLEEAIALALKNNKEIQEGKLQVESDTAALREAKADLYPTLDLDGGFDYSNKAFLESISDDIINDSVDELIEENPNFSQAEARSIIEDEYSDYDVASAEISANVTLSYDIYDGGYRGANIRSTTCDRHV